MHLCVSRFDGSTLSCKPASLVHRNLIAALDLYVVHPCDTPHSDYYICTVCNHLVIDVPCIHTLALRATCISHLGLTQSSTLPHVSSGSLTQAPSTLYLHASSLGSSMADDNEGNRTPHVSKNSMKPSTGPHDVSSPTLVHCVSPCRLTVDLDTACLSGPSPQLIAHLSDGDTDTESNDTIPPSKVPLHHLGALARFITRETRPPCDDRPFTLAPAGDALVTQNGVQEGSNSSKPELPTGPHGRTLLCGPVAYPKGPPKASDLGSDLGSGGAQEHCKDTTFNPGDCPVTALYDICNGFPTVAHVWLFACLRCICLNPDVYMP